MKLYTCKCGIKLPVILDEFGWVVLCFCGKYTRLSEWDYLELEGK